MMNSRHLPAGQGMPPDVGRRRPYNSHNHSLNHNHQHQNQSQHQHQNQHQHQHQHQQYPPPNQMYNANAYMHPYNPNFYPQPQQLPPQYHAPTLPHQHQHQYNPYPPYVRSPPPPMQHYSHPPMPQPQQSYVPPPQLAPRPHQSPSVSTPYGPPPPQTPSSTQSSHTVAGPMTPPTPQTALSVAPSPPQETPLEPFRAPLPWLSRPDLPWPARRARRKRKQNPQLSAESVELPSIQPGARPEDEKAVEVSAPAAAAATRPETPLTSHPHSEATNSTNPTTPSSINNNSLAAAGETTPVAPKSSQKPPVPAVPVVPAIPKAAPRDAPKTSVRQSTEELQSQVVTQSAGEAENKTGESTDQAPTDGAAVTTSPKAWTTPKLWTGLFNGGAPAHTPASVESGHASATGFAKTNAESVAEALRSYSPSSSDSRVAFLKPRGLINTGNMCYMNSVLQVLISCAPFYTFLDQVSKRAAYSFKSETPLIDAMIMFMREYPVIDSAPSVEKLRMRLKEGELEEYGEPFTPDFVYDVIKALPRFSSMRRGHQQDAEEFLGFLLEGLHDESVQVMKASASSTTSAIATPTNGPSSPTSEVAPTTEPLPDKDNGWLEVGPKQKAAVTRSSGTIITGSPITKIFGGNLRSELRVPGLKDSVTLEPYQPLQLDIGAPDVNNIVDALKGLTRSEALHGDFKSPKGPNVTATKQVFIETLPTVLILHLKRFQYDSSGGTQKIWKKIGYPLELEIPKEVFPRQKRSVYAHGGVPKYRLIAAVYHHGKNASGGHYTVDVRRQDGREWIRLDDTVIRRVRSEDVAEGGSEEDPKVLAAALQEHRKDKSLSGNLFSTIDDEEDTASEEGWKQASGPGKKWSSVVNGASTPRSKSDKSSIKDNKVAYLLFYQKI